MKVENVSRVPVAIAAELLGLSILSVQGALINNALPIGGAWKNEKSSCYTYHISPQQLALYIGSTKEDIMKICINA
ncbi:MAG TPA: hypothetical protein DHW61_12005 [Lachnoclostridium phytofermentans]|uniref:Uncharacterized protein n=1 Tax=Lachnoclostridium phytofermentans TaxID=66219 RepID=A0A3D2X7I5_9FIRM|nr:hypothetical protein [Lachnoclostridium sp.]HCL03110.1 hypothetical protein [Lachnoclostridium phytofermentans]